LPAVVMAMSSSNSSSMRASAPTAVAGVRAGASVLIQCSCYQGQLAIPVGALCQELRSCECSWGSHCAVRCQTKKSMSVASLQH
jgi:hypothetical protein